MSKIIWDNADYTHAWLSNAIKCSGISITTREGIIAANHVKGPLVHIEAINSRGKPTPGFINIPINKIPDIVDTLIRIRNEHNT